MRIVFIDGEAVTPEKASISVYDRGFLYGDSVFETVRTYRGSPFALDEHIARLSRSAQRVFITLPVTPSVIANEVRQAVACAGNAESYARVMLTRGQGPLGLDPDLAECAKRVILVEPLSAPPLSAYRDGIAVALSRTTRTTDQTQASGAKVANYLMSLLALREAKRAGAVEAIIVDASGHVVEGATSNVFIVENGVLVTPPEQSGILPGITRERLIDIARTEGVAVELRPFLEEELLSAAEVFISSSIREVLPVVRVGRHVVGNARPGPITRRLHAAFRKAVGAPEPLPWEG